MFTRNGIFKSNFSPNPKENQQIDPKDSKDPWKKDNLTKNLKSNFKNTQNNQNENSNNNTNNTLPSDQITEKYYELVIRRIEIVKNNYIYDCLFFDVTRVIKSKIKIYEENCKREKILAKMAHEFKTPINSIIGLIGIIKENLLNNSQNSEKTLNLIENLSKYVLFLISDIVHYLNPLENHDVKIVKDYVNLKECLNFCYEISKSLISCNRIKMENVKSEIFLDPELNNIQILTDEQRFKQILLNLLSNSVKFTNYGEIKISARLQVQENLNALNCSGKIIVSVSDTGIGIKDENKDKLFKDYSKINETNSINKLGDGLGLSICKYLAKKLDMKIEYKSEFGKGTRFDLILDYNYKNEKSEGINLDIIEMNKNEKFHKMLNFEYNIEDINRNALNFNLLKSSNTNKEKDKEKASKFKYALNIMNSSTSLNNINLINNENDLENTVTENSRISLINSNNKRNNKSNFCSISDIKCNDSSLIEVSI